MLNGVCVPLHDRQPAVLPLGERGVRLHRRVRGARRPEGLLDDHVGLARSRRRRRRGGCGSGGRRCVPAIGRTSIETASLGRGRRLRRAASAAPRRDRRRSASKTAGSSSYSTVDEPRGGAGRLARGRGDRGDDVAGVARHVGEHALVLDLAAVEPEVGDVLGRQHDAVRRHRRRVDRHHARVRVRRAHERGVQHAGPLDVDRVALRAGHARSIRCAHAASTARRTSTAITRRRYSAEPRASRQRLDPLGVARGATSRPASPLAQVREVLRRLGHGADDDAQPPSPRAAATATHGRSSARARAELAVHRPLRRGRHAHLDEQLVGLDARLVVAEDQLADRDRALAARASAAPRGRRARRAPPAGRTRSRRRPARRRPSPGCARAGSPPAPNARASTGQPPRTDRRARRAVRDHRAQPQLAVLDRRSPRSSSTRPSDSSADGRQEPLVHQDAQERPAREHRRLVAALGAERERLLERRRAPSTPARHPRISTTPVAPLTRIRSPVLIRSPALVVPTTAGIPNSRATTAGCDDRAAGLGDQPGDLREQHDPRRVGHPAHEDLALLAPGRTRRARRRSGPAPSTTPGEAARPLTSPVVDGSPA